MQQVYHFAFKAMGSQCEIRLAAVDADLAQTCAQQAIDEVLRIEHKYSRYRTDSIVSRINSAAGSDEWISCDAETSWLLDYAETLFQRSQGLFDITSGVLRRVWNFAEQQRPSQQQLDRLLTLIDWSLVERQDRHVRLALSGMEIDFGGFGKEYAADQAARVLVSRGISHGYVNFGGDLLVIGPQPDGEAWLIGVQDPRNTSQMVATIPVFKGALATSGDYETFFEVDGRRYCHILNPATGQPVNYWRSVTVLAPQAIVAGSCTTIAMLKEEAGEQFLQQTGFSYFAIDQHGAFHQYHAA